MEVISKLKPNDYELIKMIKGIIEVNPEIKECKEWYTVSIIGAPYSLLRIVEDVIIDRVGDYIFKIQRSNNFLKVQILYSNIEHNYIHHVACNEDNNVGALFRFKFENIRAIRVCEENKEELFKFTGSGNIMKPIGERWYYYFVNSNGAYMYAYSGDYIMKIDNDFHVWHPNVFNTFFERQKM